MSGVLEAVPGAFSQPGRPHGPGLLVWKQVPESLGPDLAPDHRYAARHLWVSSDSALGLLFGFSETGVGSPQKSRALLASGAWR